jgi:hypothetical protein
MICIITADRINRAKRRNNAMDTIARLLAFFDIFIRFKMMLQRYVPGKYEKRTKAGKAWTICGNLREIGLATCPLFL